MTRIDFYVLQSNDTHSKHVFVCRLIDKAVQTGSQVMVVTENATQTQQLDDLLWSFKPESYIPHQKLKTNRLLHEEEKTNQEPVVISHEFDDAHHHDVFINLCLDIPKQFSRFERVAEIVNQEEATLLASRKNYAYYKERGYPISTHKLRF